MDCGSSTANPTAQRAAIGMNTEAPPGPKTHRAGIVPMAEMAEDELQNRECRSLSDRRDMTRHPPGGAAQGNSRVFYVVPVGLHPRLATLVQQDIACQTRRLAQRAAIRALAL